MTTIGDYQLGGKIGKGGFAEVYSGTDTRTGERVAIKRLERSSFNPDEQIKREIQAFRKLDHQGVVGYKDHFITPRYVYICMELVSGGELYDYLEKATKFEEERARGYFRQLIEAVEYCHAVGLCHRDLKLENVLVAANGRLKITDFGFSKNMTRAAPKTVVGTALYVAPEVVLNNGEGYDGKGADTWSLGIILYLLTVGRFPFNRGHVGGVGPGMNSRQQDRFRTDNFRAPAHLSPPLVELLRQVLVADPGHRATIEQIKQHPWYTEDGRIPAAPAPIVTPSKAARSVSVEDSSASPAVAWDVLDSPKGDFEQPKEADEPQGFDGFGSDSDDEDDWSGCDVRNQPAGLLDQFSDALRFR